MCIRDSSMCATLLQHSVQISHPDNLWESFWNKNWIMQLLSNSNYCKRKYLTEPLLYLKLILSSFLWIQMCREVVTQYENSHPDCAWSNTKDTLVKASHCTICASHQLPHITLQQSPPSVCKCVFNLSWTTVRSRILYRSEEVNDVMVLWKCIKTNALEYKKTNLIRLIQENVEFLYRFCAAGTD